MNINIYFVYSVLLIIFAGCLNSGDDDCKIDKPTGASDTTFHNGFCDEDTAIYASVFLDIAYFDEIEIYDHPYGDVIGTVKNDSIKEDFIFFRLIEKNDDMFSVFACSSMTDEVIAKGWINKDSHLKIYSSTYHGDMKLYKSPSRDPYGMITIKEYNPNMYEVVDFCDNWLKIIAEERGTVYEGWMPPEEQCCNIYSTCN